MKHCKMNHVKYISCPTGLTGRKEEIMKTKKLVSVKGSSGRYFKMYLHKYPNNKHGYYITEAQFNHMDLRETSGWRFDSNDLQAIDCKWINVHMEKEWMEDWTLWEE